MFSMAWGGLPAWAWGIGGLIGAAGFWIWIERASAEDWRGRAEAAEVQNGTLRDRLDQTLAVNAGNVAELARMRATHARDLADLGAELERARRAGTRLTIVRQEIARDPDAATPMADRCPPLDRFLDRLFDDGGDRTAPGDPHRAGGDPASGGPSRMPAGTVDSAGRTVGR